MTRPRIVLAGHSHLTALQAGHEERPDTRIDIRFIQFWSPQYEPLIAWKDGRYAFNDVLVADIEAAVNGGAADALVLTILGAEHYIWSAQAQERPLDFILPEAPALERVAGVDVVPYDLVRRFMERQLAGFFAFVQHITGRVDVPVFQLMPPPPLSDPERMATHSPPFIRELVDRFGAPHPIVRQKLWLTWCAIAGKAAAEAGVRVLPPPPPAIDASGRLAPDFFHTDAVHGNARYGALVLGQLADTLAEAC